MGEHDTVPQTSLCAETHLRAWKAIHAEKEELGEYEEKEE
jgi:hypothetical protein